jgi:thiol-disulfide isomerase/thioredoxin
MKKILALSLLALLAFLLVASGCKSSPQGSQNTAPDFKMPLLDLKKGGDSVRGKTVSISDFKGKPLVFNFWAPWCPPCRAEAPELVKVYENYKTKGVQFLAVAIRDSDENIVQFVKDNNFTLPVGIDTDAEFAGKYGVSGIPTTFFIDGSGKIIRTNVGAINQIQMSQFVEELLR